MENLENQNCPISRSVCSALKTPKQTSFSPLIDNYLFELPSVPDGSLFFQPDKPPFSLARVCSTTDNRGPRIPGSQNKEMTRIPLCAPWNDFKTNFNWEIVKRWVSVIFRQHRESVDGGKPRTSSPTEQEGKQARILRGTRLIRCVIVMR